VILITGATGYTGRFLVARLLGAGEQVRCLVRPTSNRASLDTLGVEICLGDLERPGTLVPAFAGAEVALHLAHVRYTRSVLAAAGPELRRVVVVSSMRRFSRVPSRSVDEVIAGEESALEAGPRVVLLRPTMIYGPGDDRNLSRLAGFLRRYRWFPVFGQGRALQQPVHVEDVVAAIMAAAVRPEAAGRQYTLAGQRAVTYDQLVDLIAAAVGVRPVKVHLPVPLVLALARLLPAAAGRRLGLEPEQVRRLQEDKSCSIAAAAADLGFAPVDLVEGLRRVHGREARND
jgi:nucleoside-diphosphate-sugar epimerase